MELFQAKDDYILQSGDRALWCSRKDGTMTLRPGTYRMTSSSALPSHVSVIITFGTVRSWLGMVLVYLSTLCCVDTAPVPQVVSFPRPILCTLGPTRAHQRSSLFHIELLIEFPPVDCPLLLISGMPTPLWHSECLPSRLVLRFPRTEAHIGVGREPFISAFTSALTLFLFSFNLNRRC